MSLYDRIERKLQVKITHEELDELLYGISQNLLDSMYSDHHQESEDAIEDVLNIVEKRYSKGIHDYD